jgi:hypothetical protein
MVRRQIVEARTRSGRKERRRELGTLKSLVVRPATIVRYERAFKHFVAYLHQQGSEISRSKIGLDHQIEDYLEFLWEEGLPLSLAGDTLSSITYFQPATKHNLAGSWKLLRAWQAHELPCRAPPVTWEVLCVLLGWFHGLSPSVSVGLYLAFRALLRTGELLSVQAKHLVIADNEASGLLYLGLTKTGSRNPMAGHVTIHDRTLLHLLRLWKATAEPDQYIIPWSSSYFRVQFSKAIDHTHLSALGLKPYSLRRGGATELWLSTHNYSQVAYAGRWTSERTLKLYIHDSLALLTDITFRPSPYQNNLIHHWQSVSRVEPSVHRKGRGRGTKRS